MFTIRTENCGNIDHGQSPLKAVAPVQTLEAPTLVELKATVRQWQDNHQIGGGNWLNPSVFDGGTLVGYMSYNTRLWKTAGEEVTA